MQTRSRGTTTVRSRPGRKGKRLRLVHARLDARQRKISGHKTVSPNRKTGSGIRETPDGWEREGYQPIANYGVIGDLQTIGPAGIDGSIDFMCYPDFDSPSTFAALLDWRKGGSFKIA